MSAIGIKSGEVGEQHLMSDNVVVVNFRRRRPAGRRGGRSVVAKELAARLREIDETIKSLRDMRAALRAAYNKERGCLTIRTV
jgi:hypothetical protein